MTTNDYEETTSTKPPPSHPKIRSSFFSFKNSFFNKSGDIDMELEIDDSKNETNFSVERFRQSLKKFMVTSFLGFVWDVGFLLLSCVSLISFIASTYYDHRIESQAIIKDYFDIFELVLAVLFGIDWGLSFFMADQKNEFITSFYSMVDLFSVIPTW